MKRGQKDRSKQRKRKQSQTASRPPLAGHKAFAPLLGLWGILLGGLVVLALPGALVQSAVSGTLIGTWNIDAQPLLAGVAAAMVGLVLFSVSAGMHANARRVSAPSVVDRALRQRVTPINPVRDLGTRSLDDPLEAMPFTTPAWLDADLDASAPAREPAPEPVPVELDLAQFAELPGRNAVWVEELPAAAAEPEAAPEPEAEPEQQPDPVADIRARRLRAVAAPLPPAPGTAALARLRAVPPSELSLAEMVERFAGALHEHRETPPTRALSAADLAAREAALSEALKALAALSGGAAALPARPKRDEPLRAALAQLQPQRGAA